MVRPGRELLSGTVEVDETIVGGACRGAHPMRNKKIVIIAAEVRGRGIGRIRLESIPHDLEATIGFVRRSVAPGSEVISDGSWAYRHLPKYGYRHSGTALLGKGRVASLAVLPRVHRIAALLKRWLLGTYQGRPSSEQLEHYLQEFAFRFNRRLSPTRGQLFYRLAQQCANQTTTTYEAIKAA